MTARVVLADDEPVFRLGLRAALHAPPLPVEVVGETDEPNATPARPETTQLCPAAHRGGRLRDDDVGPG
jgi:DNA-binding NarL/FixJ family response regulator